MKLLHRFGLSRNRSLRENIGYENEVIGQAEQDDLLVLVPKPQRYEIVVESAA